MHTDEQVRQKIFERMADQGLRQVDLARRLDISPQAVGQILSGRKARIPKSLLDVLDALNLELTITPRKTPPMEDGE